MIREASHADLDDLVRLGMRFGLERSTLPVAENAVAATVAEMLDSPVKRVLVLDTGEVVGAMAVCLYDHPYTGERTAFELFWWVDPAQESAGIRSVRLLKAAEEWATSEGCALFQTMAPKGSPVRRLYERLGFRETETMYQRRL